MIPQDMIPQEKMAAVTRGLREAFGVTEFEDIRRMTKGHNYALVFRIVVKGSPFLLRVNMQGTSMIGPERQFGCMKAAAEADLAPRIWYASIEDQVSIIDFVEEAPFPATAALVLMPHALRTLHSLPPFPGVVSHLDTSCMFLMSKGPALDGFIQKFRAANLLPQADCDELFARYEQVSAVYPLHESDMASSHNDLFKPDNILFDGRRVWLVDWEAAFFNDRYADLAVVANMLVTDEVEERAFLHEYFGQPPDEYQLARFFLMRQVARMFYTIAFLFIGSLGEPADQSENAPDLKDFRRRYWAGDVSLVDKRMKTAYGRYNWEQLIEDVRTPRYDEALRIVAAGRPLHRAVQN